MSTPTTPRAISIWWFAFGYFASYVPYSAMTKALSKGWDSMPGLTGLSILPVSVMTSMIASIAFLWLSGWWRYAGRHSIAGVSVPGPNVWTFLSGLCTALIVVTTTLAYTFEGVSIVFVMLLMRGGVLVLAPVVDALTGRHVRWFSWVGLALSAAALLTGVIGNDRYVVTIACGIDIALYLTAYFVRLRFMSRLAKGGDRTVSIRFFAEEQMVGTPAAVLLLAILAFLPGIESQALEQIRWGFTEIWSHPALWAVILIGLFSQGTGLFGGLILLDPRENTYCVPVNRASSVLAGIVASYMLVLLTKAPLPGVVELVGAGLVIAAIVALSVPPLLEKRREAAAVARMSKAA